MRLSFTCTNLLPVVSWILQWGPHAKVIEPAELAATIIDELERARAQYSSPPQRGISIDDKDKIETRAADTRSGAPGIAWHGIKRDILK